MSVRTIISFLLLLLCQVLFGQQLQFDNLRSKMPLPSQECYNIMQDSKGYIWFATEQGFCRYDGNNLRVYDLKNGLPEGAVYSVVEDSKGRLWLLTSRNRILIMEKGVLREAAFSKSFQKQSGREIPYSLVLLGDELYINTYGDTFIADIAVNSLKKIPRKHVSKAITVMQRSGQLIPMNSYRDLSTKVDIPLSDFSIKIIGDVTKEISIPRTELFLSVIMVSAKKAGMMSFMNQVVSIGQSGPVAYELPKRVLSICKDKKGSIWIGTIQDGLYYYEDGDLSKEPMVHLRGYSVTGVMEDTEGNIWCTTLEKGLFKCVNKNVVNYFNVPGLAKKVDLLKSVDGISYFSSRANELIRLEGNSTRNCRINTYSREAITDLYKLDKGWYVGGKGFIAIANADFKNARNINQGKENIYAATQFVSANGKLYGLSYSTLVEIDQDKVRIIVAFGGRSRYFNHYKGDRFFYAFDNDLRIADVKTGKTTRVATLKGSITKILTTANKQTWITTKGGGLYRFSDGKAVPVNELFGLKPRILYDVIAVGSDLWIGSNEGLVKVRLQSRTSEVYTTDNGLPTNEIYKLSFDGKQLFLSTLEGICSFQVGTRLKNDYQPNIYLNALTINGIPQRNAAGWKLKHSQNSMSIVFDALTFKGEPRLFYRLKGRDAAFSINKGNTITFENLLPGNYTLIVYALNSDGVKSKKPVVLSFDIAQPFWKEIWFVLLCLALSVLAIYIVVRTIIRNIKAKEKEKTRINKLIADSQLSALQAQMNPHFIFNAINSIQNYILKNREKEAYGYLAKFSKLIRMVLHNSQQQLLPLHEELETVKLYIELEQLRFKNSFDFDTIMAPDVDVFQVMVPTMIIQPYLENAIWHGLMNLEGQRRGKITLEIGNEKGLLIITITDNGVGRQLAATYKKENTHQPVAMKLTKQRVAIVNQSYGNGEISVAVEDLYDKDGHPQGTKVTIALPVNTE